MIKYCGCTRTHNNISRPWIDNTAGARFQDEKYGKGMRVFTTDKDGQVLHCTVCNSSAK